MVEFFILVGDYEAFKKGETVGFYKDQEPNRFTLKITIPVDEVVFITDMGYAKIRRKTWSTT